MWQTPELIIRLIPCPINSLVRWSTPKYKNITMGYGLDLHM